MDWKKRTITLVAVLAALLLAGCKFRASTTIRPSGSGELRTETGFTAEDKQNLQKHSGSAPAQDLCNTSKPPPGSSVTEEQRGDET